MGHGVKEALFRESLLSAPCSLLLAPCLFIHFNGHIRADSPAHGTAGTVSGVLKKNEMISFFVKILRETDHFFGAHRQAKLTAFASVFIDFDLSHSSFLISTYWDADSQDYKNNAKYKV